MASELKAAKAKSSGKTSTTTMRATSVSMTTKVKETKEPPAGAKILDKTIRTETEEIENGFLISKNFDITWEEKGERHYSYYTKKWYSKTDPLSVKLTDTALADEFEAED